MIPVMTGSRLIDFIVLAICFVALCVVSAELKWRRPR